jgi:ABC-type antimicrobial peptide transport system permease subunit
VRGAAQYAAEALAVLIANRTRSLLTALGLIIGVMAVVSIQILGSGMAGAIGGVLGSLNDSSFTLIPNVRQSDFTRAQLKASDVERAKRMVPNILEAIPAGGITRLTSAGHAHARLSIVGESEPRIFNAPLRYGRSFAPSEIAQAAHVALISDEAYTKLFAGAGDPTGRSLRVGDHRYVIIGTTAKPKTGIIPNVLNVDVLIPYTTYEREFLRGRTVFGARFLVADTSQLAATETATVNFFVKLKAGRAEYQTFDRKTISGTIDAIFTGVTFVVALIGAVSLVVAGIGILNIMLVSVAERTREIGLRKAIGATRRQILAQFFIEALLLSTIGCAIGLALGLALGGAVNAYGIVKISGIVAPIPWLRSIVIAAGFATTVTLLFGTYPAYRAAGLDPIEALRYE